MFMTKKVDTYIIFIILEYDLSINTIIVIYGRYINSRI